MGTRNRPALQGTEDDDLAKYMRLAGSRRMVDTTQVIHDDECFILHSEDGLVKPLSKIPRVDSKRYTVHMSMQCTEAGGDPSQDDRFEIIFVRERKGDGQGAAEGAELTSKSKKWLNRMRPGRRLRMLNLGLGVAVFATMSAISLVALSPPLSYVFAAGALAPAGIMLIRAARGHV